MNSPTVYISAPTKRSRNCQNLSENMAAKSAMPLSSRFGVLRVDDFPDSDEEGQEMTVNERKETEAKAAAEAAKKRNKKKKKAQQQGTAKAELRNMAFTKIASVPKEFAPAPPASKPPVVHPEVLRIGSPPKTTKDWEKWQEKDQDFVDNQYHQDLQRAILQSKLEQERREKFLSEIGPVVMEEDSAKPQNLNRKERRKLLHGKDKPQPMSLQEFHQEGAKDVRATADVGLDDIYLPPEPPEENKEILSSIKEEINKAMAKEKKSSRKKSKSESSNRHDPEVDGARQAQYQDELEKKDAEKAQLQETVDKLKAELAQVKKRNKQLCFIIGQGEMKDKAAVITQVEELTTEKDELTAEVAELYAALEQEKSKVSSLKAELQKLHEKKK